MTVNVRAVIWVDGGLLVHKVRHRGEERVTLPGGRVKERETVEAALAREVEEETGLGIVIGPLLYVAEVVNSYSTQNRERGTGVPCAMGSTSGGETGRAGRGGTGTVSGSTAIRRDGPGIDARASFADTAASD